MKGCHFCYHLGSMEEKKLKVSDTCEYEASFGVSVMTGVTCNCHVRVRAWEMVKLA